MDLQINDTRSLNLTEESLEAGAGGSPGDLGFSAKLAPRGRGVVFTNEQRQVLLRYFDEYSMTSTHRRNTDIIQRCADEVGTSVERVKNWIGSEAVKRKRKAGLLPRPKVELSGGVALPKASSPPPSKKMRRVNGYNLFFSNCVRTCPEISSDFRERNAAVALKWAELTEEERKQWAAKAEMVCSTSAQEVVEPKPAPPPLLSADLHAQLQQQKAVNQLLLSQNTITPDLSTEAVLVERTLLGIQEKFDLLEQLGFEGYAVLVNTGELQTHLLATTKGKAYHKMKQQSGKPLENPFIGFVFTEDLDTSTSSLNPTMASPTTPPTKRLSSAFSSIETMQKSVMNAFTLKYKVATGRSEVPYDNLQTLGVQVYGMPPGIPFHSPMLYNQQQLQQILASLEKVVFLKIGPQSLHDSVTPLTEVEIATEAVGSLVAAGHHDIHVTSEEEDP